MNDKDLNKKSITLFFCDIYGTIDQEFTDEECQEFSNLLEKIIIQNNSDYLLFAIASTEEKHVKEEYEKKITKYFEKNIKILPKLPENNKLDEIKIAFIANHINHLKQKYNIEEIFLADDSEFNHHILKELLLELTDIELESIIPRKNNNNLRFINDSLKEILKNRNTKKK